MSLFKLLLDYSPYQKCKTTSKNKDLDHIGHFTD